MLIGCVASAGAPVLAWGQQSENSARLEFTAHLANLLGSDAPPTTVWSAGSSWPPPVLRAKQGAEFRVDIANRLDRDIYLHWHGVRGPSAMMSLKVAPGAGSDLKCVFTPPDAGTFWFGPVADVSRQREMGLYGLLIVEEAQPVSGINDLPMVLDDWQIHDDGTIDEGSFGSLDDAIGQGRLGNWFTINGQYRPQLEIPRGLVSRLRLLNAANVRTMPVLFKGADPLIAAFDGQPVALRNLGASPLVLAPGQRCDLLVLEGDEDVTIGLDLFEDIVEIGYLRRGGLAGSSGLPENFAFPANPVSANIEPDGAVQASLIIEGGAKGGLKSARLNGETVELRTLLERGFAWSINGNAGLAAEPWMTFPKGATVNVNVENRTRFNQPLHIHGHVWRLIESDGQTRDGEPWRDTAIIEAGKTARLAFIADNPGVWGLHSTLAERIDSGLITSFAVDH